MNYKAEYYTEILNAVVKAFRLDPNKVPKQQWIFWRAQIKRLFDRGILIREIVSAIPEAARRCIWNNQGFFTRVEGVVLEQRRDASRVSDRSGGLTSIGALLK